MKSNDVHRMRSSMKRIIKNANDSHKRLILQLDNEPNEIQSATDFLLQNSRSFISSMGNIWTKLYYVKKKYKTEYE